MHLSVRLSLCSSVCQFIYLHVFVSLSVCMFVFLYSKFKSFYEGDLNVFPSLLLIQLLWMQQADHVLDDTEWLVVRLRAESQAAQIDVTGKILDSFTWWCYCYGILLKKMSILGYWVMCSQVHQMNIKLILPPPLEILF